MLVSKYALSTGSPTKVCLEVKVTGWWTGWFLFPNLPVTRMIGATPWCEVWWLPALRAISRYGYPLNQICCSWPTKCGMSSPAWRYPPTWSVRNSKMPCFPSCASATFAYKQPFIIKLKSIETWTKFK